MGKKDWNGKRHRFYYNFFLYTPFIAISAGARMMLEGAVQSNFIHADTR